MIARLAAPTASTRRSTSRLVTRLSATPITTVETRQTAKPRTMTSVTCPIGCTS